MKINLYNYQKKTYEHLKEQNKMLIGYEMGLGKTITVLKAWWDLCNNHLFVLAPPLVDSWQVEAKKYFPNVKIVDLRKYSSAKAQIKLKYFFSSETQERKIFIASYQSSWRYGDVLLKVKKNFFTLVCDESQNVKNRSSKQSKYVFKLSKRSDRVWLLSGTPMSVAWEDLFFQLKILGAEEEEFNNWKKFEERFLIIREMRNYATNFAFRKVVGYRNETELLLAKDKYADMVDLKKAQVDLPDKIEKEIMLEAPKKYNQILKERTFKTWKMQNSGSKFAAARTAASGFLYGEDRFGNQTVEKLEDSKKQKMLEELFNETNETIVVFYNFVQEARDIREAAAKTKRTIGFVNGKEYDITKNVIAIQYQSGSTGLNLQEKSRITIFYSPTISGVNFLQSKARTHRIGQKSTCFYYHFIIKDSVEEKIIKKVKANENYTQQLFEEEFEKEKE